MKEHKCCEECNKNVTELHHIVFRSQAPYMANIKINFKYLCPEDHRGNNGPHMNKDIDFKYKYELQTKLFEMFNKPYCTEKEIKELLKTTSSEVRKIVKKLKLYKEGTYFEEREVQFEDGKFVAAPVKIKDEQMSIEDIG